MKRIRVRSHLASQHLKHITEKRVVRVNAEVFIASQTDTANKKVNAKINGKLFIHLNIAIITYSNVWRRLLMGISSDQTLWNRVYHIKGNLPQDDGTVGWQFLQFYRLNILWLNAVQAQRDTAKAYIMRLVVHHTFNCSCYDKRIDVSNSEWK